MSGVAGDIMVGVAVLTSVAYAAATLGPKSWRARLFAALASASRAWATLRWPGGTPGTVSPAWLRWLGSSRALALRMAGRLDAASTQAGGCGGCGNCGSAAPGAQSASGVGAAGEVRVPVAKIRRR
jgi:hypothetical protein